MTLTLERSASARHSERPAGIIRRIAASYKITTGSAEQFLYGGVGLPARMERLLTQLVDFGATPLAEKILARFAAIVAQRPAPELDAPLILSEADADADEDRAEVAFQLDRSDANLERWAKAAEKQAYKSTEVALALRQEQRRRGGGK